MDPGFPVFTGTGKPGNPVEKLGDKNRVPAPERGPGFVSATHGSADINKKPVPPNHLGKITNLSLAVAAKHTTFIENR
jgi:hypothetical protein